MPRPTQTWKTIERNVSRITGGKRVIEKGGHSMAEDVSHPVFSIEVKTGRSLPSIYATYAQAKRNAPDGKVPLAIHHRHGDSKYYAILDLADLMRLTGGGDINAIVGDNPVQPDA